MEDTTNKTKTEIKQKIMLQSAYKLSVLCRKEVTVDDIRTVDKALFRRVLNDAKNDITDEDYLVVIDEIMMSLI